ncbi:MAG: DNA mismatch repair protein MutS [Planctomycetota bacterium]|nr:DNA mismatch repair protein MutS [Planctomycetota bacterium]
MPDTSPQTDPRAVYEERLAERTRLADAAAARATRISNWRLGAFLVTVGLFLASLGWNLTAHALWLPLAAFVVLVIRHAGAAAEERRARAAASLYAQGLRRLDGTWAGHGRAGEGLAAERHPYAGDLDLFGRGSVFELLCTVRTQVGERRLADWLLAPAAPETARARQAAVAELAPQLDWREQLAYVEDVGRSAFERGAAQAWAREPVRLTGRARLWCHRVLGVISTVLLVGWLGFDWKPLWMVLAFVVQYVFAALERADVQTVLDDADRPAQDLALIARILEQLEASSFEAPHLATQLARLRSGNARPSQDIRRLVRVMDLVDARRNQIFLPISWLLSLGTQLAYALESWRAEHGEALSTWLDVIAETEALASLATYAFEHPDDVFPEFASETCLRAEGLGHPLLASDDNVRNDVDLALERPTPQALLISGSNMSGKSTLLRSVGVAAVMAFAGAPVRARALTLSPLAVGASIQLHDSLQEGASRFYAEIERLRQVVDLSAQSAPALFLLDEVLHGTNSQDRRVGAAAVVRTLLEAGALGLVTTHDLALAAIAEDGTGRVRNMHFEDQVADGRIAFDYTLRPGVVQRGNALALMRMVGLEVDELSESAEDADI